MTASHKQLDGKLNEIRAMLEHLFLRNNQVGLTKVIGQLADVRWAMCSPRRRSAGQQATKVRRLTALIIQRRRNADKVRGLLRLRDKAIETGVMRKVIAWDQWRTNLVRRLPEVVTDS